MKPRYKTLRASFEFNLEQLEDRFMLTADAFEQHAVYLINIERHDRDLPPLAINGRLMESAGEKAADLVNCFQNICSGKGPSDWAADAGYGAIVDELIATYFPSGKAEDQAQRAVDQWMSNALHRDVLLSDKAEIGVGRAKVGNDVYWAVQLGTSNPDDVFLTGTVFNDRNDDQRYDYGEGVPGVTITDGDASATTNAGGGWKLRVAPNIVQNLSASGGAFDGKATLDVSVQNESRSVDFVAGSDRVFVDYAPLSTAPMNPPNDGGGGKDNNDDGSNDLAATGRLSGRVFVDLDENGEKSPLEERLANWIVYIDTNRNRRRDAGEPQERTDANGRYEFELSPAKPIGHGHLVTVELQPNFENTTTRVRSVLIEPGIHKTNKDFGVIRENGVSGFVFHDTNRDGARSRSERRFEGWTVFVDGNQNGRLDAGERRSETNANGRFTIHSLPPGIHTLAVVSQTGFDFTTIASRSVSVQATHVAKERNFGVVAARPTMGRPPRAATKNTAQISGRVFEDLNSDGERTANESHLANWRVYVDANRNGRRDPAELSTLTDDDGSYEFTLPTSTHWIGVESRSQFEFTTNQSRSVAISDGQSKTQRDFGVIGALSISGMIREQVLRNGLVGTGSESVSLQPKTCIGLSTTGCSTQNIVTPPATTWTVFLDANRNSRLDAGERFTTTDQNGRYKFNSLQATVYRVVVMSPSAYMISGANGIGGGERSVSLINGLSRNDISFSVSEKTGKVNGRVLAGASGVSGVDTPLANRIVFSDANDDGRRDPGEQWTRTNSDGWYSLTLEVGVQRIRVELGVHERSTTAAGPRRSVNIREDQTIPDKDFGIVRP